MRAFLKVRSRRTILLSLTAALIVSGCSRNATSRPDPGQLHTSEQHAFTLEAIGGELEHPWGMAFLPEGDEVLITERPGRLRRLNLSTGEMAAIAGVPEVAASGQGGLLDVALHPDFKQTRWVYLTYAGRPAEGSGAATTLGRGRLDGDALADFEVLYVAGPYLSTTQHFGSRVAFDDEGYLFMSVGDRGERNLSQDRSNAIGTTLRLNEDGEIPTDNPFVDEPGVEPAIYSYGHRNVQAMAFQPSTGALWQIEHGPRGGDEVNLPEAGKNFGWPLTSYGVEYGSRRAIGPAPHEHEGTAAPAHHWQESFAPSGAAFYEGDAFPSWRGDLFVGSLVREHLARLTVDGTSITGEEPLLDDFGWRIRDVRVGPEGYLYLLIDASDAPLVRLRPAED